jgi:GNAT superfamily N-acetyltransferase
MSRQIKLAAEDKDIRRCYPVMAELRPHLDPEEFLRKVKKQGELAGYRLAYLTDGGVRAVAGFRVTECLAWGKFMRVDDLATRSEDRSKGYGGELFDWLVTLAKEEGCDQLHLDSRVQRFGAHRFYLSKRMIIECHHFSLGLKSSPA